MNLQMNQLIWVKYNPLQLIVSLIISGCIINHYIYICIFTLLIIDSIISKNKKIYNNYMEDIFDNYINDLIRVNPIINDFFLREEFLDKKDIQPNIYSEEYYKQIDTINKKYFKILEKHKDLSFREKIMKEDISHYIHLENEYKIYFYMPINIQDNILIKYVTDCSGNGFYRFEIKKDYMDFISRLKSLDSITDEIIKKMKSGIKDGVTLYKGTVDYMIYQINKILKEKPYENKKVLISKKLWEEQVEKYLINNLKKLNDFLMIEYYGNCSTECGLHSYKGGKKAYRYILKMNTLKEATPEKIHTIGLSELKRLMKEKGELEKKINMGNIDEYIKNNKADYYTTKKEVLKDLHKIKEDTIKNIHNKYFHGEIKKKEHYEIKSISVENSNNFAYYLSADLKGVNKGTFYINTSSPNKINKNELYVLSLHEGIPGHHYEINYHNKRGKLDYFKGVSYDSYSEGWGMYSEGLGDYTNDKKYYFRIQYNILRSLRLVIDTGIHYFGWSYKRCFNYMKEYLDYSDTTIHQALLRYIDIPCQALTYKIGERTILYLRDKYLTDGGTIKDFHKIIMDLGPCPLDFLVDTLTGLGGGGGGR